MHLTRQFQNIGSKKWQLKENMHSSTIMVGDFNTPLSIIGRTPRQKSNKEIEVW